MPLLYLFIDPSNRGAGQNVVKLHQQKALPDLFELGTRVFGPGLEGCIACPQFGLSQ